MYASQTEYHCLQYANSKCKSFILFNTNFAVRNLQLSVRKLKLLAPNLLTHDFSASVTVYVHLLDVFTPFWKYTVNRHAFDVFEYNIISN